MPGSNLDAGEIWISIGGGQDEAISTESQWSVPFIVYREGIGDYAKGLSTL